MHSQTCQNQKILLMIDNDMVDIVTMTRNSSHVLAFLCFGWVTILCSWFSFVLGADSCDIIFLVDSTNSISNSELSIQKEFFSTLIPYYLNTFDDSRIAIIEWSSAAQTKIFYEFTDNQSITPLNTTLQNITLRSGGGDVDSLFNFSLELFDEQSQTGTSKIMLLPTDLVSDQSDNCHYNNDLIDSNINLLVIFIENGGQTQSSLGACFTQREEYGTGTTDWNALLLSTTYDQVYTMSQTLCEKTLQPSVSPTYQPTMMPTDVTQNPTAVPTSPSSMPSGQPTMIVPTGEPTGMPTMMPSVLPTMIPSDEPTTNNPTALPTNVPSNVPTDNPGTTVASTFATSETSVSTTSITTDIDTVDTTDSDEIETSEGGDEDDEVRYVIEIDISLGLKNGSEFMFNVTGLTDYVLIFFGQEFDGDISISVINVTFNQDYESTLIIDVTYFIEVISEEELEINIQDIQNDLSQYLNQQYLTNEDDLETVEVESVVVVSSSSKTTDSNGDNTDLFIIITIVAIVVGVIVTILIIFAFIHKKRSKTRGDHTVKIGMERVASNNSINVGSTSPLDSPEPMEAGIDHDHHGGTDEVTNATVGVAVIDHMQGEEMNGKVDGRETATVSTYGSVTKGNENETVGNVDLYDHEEEAENQDNDDVYGSGMPTRDEGQSHENNNGETNLTVGATAMGETPDHDSESDS